MISPVKRVLLEWAFDTRRNALFLILKALICTLVLVMLYHLASFAFTEHEAHTKLATRSNMTLHTLVDTMIDPEAFSDFLSSPEAIQAMARFCDVLTQSEQLTFATTFNQPVPLYNFRGDETFGYTYGTTGMSSNSITDAEGTPMFQVKALQLNQKAFDFYNLGVSQGTTIPWADVDYAAGTIPVLLGARYATTYHVGDMLQGAYYSDMKNFKVVGFLDESASIWFKGQPDLTLSSYLVIPYPAHLLEQTHSEAANLMSIVVPAYFNGDLLAPSSYGTAEVIEELDRIASHTGYFDYSLIDIPAYRVQLRLMRSLIEHGSNLLIALVALLTTSGCVTVLVLDVLMARRRQRVAAVKHLLGEADAEGIRPVAGHILIEHILICPIVTAIVINLPNANALALISAIGGFVIFTLINLAVQTCALHTMAHMNACS